MIVGNLPEGSRVMILSGFWGGALPAGVWVEHRLEKPLFKGRRNSEASLGFWLVGENRWVEIAYILEVINTTSFKCQVPGLCSWNVSDLGRTKATAPWFSVSRWSWALLLKPGCLWCSQMPWGSLPVHVFQRLICDMVILLTFHLEISNASVQTSLALALSLTVVNTNTGYGS